jgi:hypothetical protein
MAGLMSWAQIASAQQMCNYAETILKITATASASSADIETETEVDIFFLRGPVEEEIHHTEAFYYKPNLNVLKIISFPHLHHLSAQVSIFEQIKPPCYS